MEYSPNAYFWEFVKMFQKIMIIILINLYDGDVKVKGVLCFMVIVVYLILSYTFKPHQDMTLTRLDQLGNECIAVSVILGVFIYSNKYGYLVGMAYFFLTVYNFYFLFLLIKSRLRGYIGIAKNVFYTKFDTIKDKLKKFPKIISYLATKHSQIIPIKRIVELQFILTESIRQWIVEKRRDPSALLQLYRRTPKPLELVKKSSKKEDSMNIMKGNQQESQSLKSYSPPNIDIENTQNNKNKIFLKLLNIDDHKEDSSTLFNLSNKESLYTTQKRKKGSKFINPSVIHILPSSFANQQRKDSIAAEDLLKHSDFENELLESPKTSKEGRVKTEKEN